MAGEKILIIEDEPSIALMVETMLRERGYQTLIAYDGVSGLELALDERPELVLLDLRLPQMSGVELLTRLYHNKINVPVVVVTALGSEDLALHALRMGVKDYVKKPFDLSELLHVIERALSEGRLRRERDTLTNQLLTSNQQLKQRVEQLTALYEVGQALASTLDLDELLRLILKEACRVLAVNLTSIFLLDERTGDLVFRLGTGGGAEQLIGQRLTPGQGIAGWVARRGEPLLVNQVQADPRFSDSFDQMTGFVTESILCVPLMVKGHVIGVLEALNKPHQGFDKDDLALLRSMATSAAVAIENTQLFKEIKRRLHESEVLFRLGKQLTALLPLQELVQIVVRGTIELVPKAGRSIMYFRDASSGALRAGASSTSKLSPWELIWRPTLKRRIMDRALQEQRTVVAQIHSCTTDKTSPDPLDAPCVWILAVPLRVQEEDMGVLIVDSQAKDAFTSEDRNILTTFANQAAIAIKNARLYQNLRESRDQVAERSEDLEKLLSKLVRLQRIALALGKLTVGADLRDVNQRLTEYAATLLEVKSSAILLLDQERQELVCQEPAYGVPLELVRKYRIPLSPGNPAREAWQEGRPVIINNVDDSPLIDLLGLRELATKRGLHCTMFSVLRMGGRSVGVFQVSDKLDGSMFTSDDQRVLEIFASQSAIAIENARLFTREKRRASEMETLVEIAQAVTEAVTERPRALLERIARGACETLRADCAVVYPFVATEPDTYDLANVASFGTLYPLEPSRQVATDDPLRIIRKHNPLVCKDIAQDRPALLQSAFFERESIQSFVGILLEADQEELGVLYVNFREPRPLKERELTSIRLIAHQAALAIAKSRLFETLNRDLFRTNADLMRKLNEMAELQKISNMVNSTLEIDKVLDSILQGAMSITGAPHANILMMEKENGTVVSHVRRNGQTLTERIHLADIARLPGFAGQEEALALPRAGDPSVDGIPWNLIYRRLISETRSFLYVPIVSGGEQKRIGLLGIGSPRSGEFGPDDRRLLETLADQAAIAIQNARYLQAMRDYQEQQVEAERIAAIADVAGNMVHRINNTVGAIRPLIQQIEIKLAQGRLEGGYLREKLDGIRENADRTLEMARQIRRPFQSVPLEPVDVNASIAAAWADLKTPVGVEMRIQYGKDLPLVKATRQLEEVFRNLMKNALDAMAQEGGLLLVRSQSQNDREVKIQVQDTGPGIPPEIEPKIFHMGVTTKAGGTGYGLWWSRMFLRRLGGDIELETREGEGCKFTVILPTARD